MDINYKFVPEFKSAEAKKKSDIVSYAGKLLEIVDSQSAFVFLDDDDVPVVLIIDSKPFNALDFDIEDYYQQGQKHI